MLLCLRLAITVSFLLVVSASDRVIYNIATQATCREVIRSARYSRECGWHAGLYRNVDQFYLKGRIAAYKIRWFSGKWSNWFVPGVNDIDIKFNVHSRYCRDFKVNRKSMRRWWSYFYDHTHKFILCTDRKWWDCPVHEIGDTVAVLHWKSKTLFCY